jgi:hypothetical protein
MNIRSGFSTQLWAFTAVLTAGLLAGCGSDRTVTGPERPSETPVNPELDAAPPAPHWADGYVWANQPTSPSYTPSTFYSFNRSGGSILITKPAGTTGQYTVRFNGLSPLLGAKSTVKVTGYFPNNAYCEPTTPRLASNVVRIRCFRGINGAPVDAYYTVLVMRNYVELAFAHANLPTGNNYAPPGNSSWNPAGPIRVFRTGIGVYQVRFTGLGRRALSNGGHVQVVAVGTTNYHCKVVSWFGNPDLVVNVRCRTRGGAPVNWRFNVLFLLPNNHLGYAWANQPSTPSYTPSTFYSWNSEGGSVQITRRGTGLYTVTFNGLSADLLDGGDVQVTAYGSTNAQCKVESWGSQSVNVRCFDQSELVDSFYDVLLGS